MYTAKAEKSDCSLAHNVIMKLVEPYWLFKVTKCLFTISVLAQPYFIDLGEDETCAIGTLRVDH